MVEFKTQLEQKWGQFEKDEYFWKQRNIASVSPNTFLNVLFIPVDIRLYKIFEEEYNCVFPAELIEFYKHYNGIMLFCQSFRIFGFNIHVDTSYKTLHLNFENRRLNFQKKCPKYSDMISFGYYAEYNFCFDRKDNKKIYVISRNTFEHVHTFNSLQELFDHYLPPLIKEYDENGDKIHPTSKTLRNLSTEFI